MKKKVLFICECNSARSQMAEGILKKLYGHEYDAYSAGIRPERLDRKAIEVMKEIGIDISLHYSKDLKGYIPFRFDYVATVCDRAKMTVDELPRAKEQLHKGFMNPAFAADNGQEIECFRQSRDEIKEWIKTIFG